MDNAITKRISTLLVNEFEVDETLLTPDANLKTTLELDSLDYVDLVALTESEFGCRINIEDFDNLVTFRDLHDFIVTHAVK